MKDGQNPHSRFSTTVSQNKSGLRAIRHGVSFSKIGQASANDVVGKRILKLQLSLVRLSKLSPDRCRRTGTFYESNKPYLLWGDNGFLFWLKYDDHSYSVLGIMDNIDDEPNDGGPNDGGPNDGGSGGPPKHTLLQLLINQRSKAQKIENNIKITNSKLKCSKNEKSQAIGKLLTGTALYHTNTVLNPTYLVDPLRSCFRSKCSANFLKQCMPSLQIPSSSIPSITGSNWKYRQYASKITKNQLGGDLFCLETKMKATSFLYIYSNSHSKPINENIVLLTTLVQGPLWTDINLEQTKALKYKATQVTMAIIEMIHFVSNLIKNGRWTARQARHSNKAIIALKHLVPLNAVNAIPVYKLLLSISHYQENIDLYKDQNVIVSEWHIGRHAYLVESGKQKIGDKQNRQYGTEDKACDEGVNAAGTLNDDEIEK